VNSSLDERIVAHFSQIESTNDVATRMAESGAPAGSIVLADSQTGGRGRLGRSWVSPAGTGLYFSMVLRPALQPSDLPKISLVAGYALCLAIEKECGLRPGLKWPNDLLLNGRKFGGILAENIPSSSPLVILGVGLNLNTPLSAFPSSLHQKATSLSAFSGEKYSRRKILGAAVNQLDIWMVRLEQGGFAEILSRWKERDVLKDKELAWLTPAGKKVTGISLGPDENGVLHIRDSTGKVHEVLSGDLSLTPNNS
jgi:BirA family biotin operon repressor/biotin-[acetyl-CoA-carboxylase] ligase